jgi:hypothetical protein
MFTVAVRAADPDEAGAGVAAIAWPSRGPGKDRQKNRSGAGRTGLGNQGAGDGQ